MDTDALSVDDSCGDRSLPGLRKHTPDRRHTGIAHFINNVGRQNGIAIAGIGGDVKAVIGRM